MWLYLPKDCRTSACSQDVRGSIFPSDLQFQMLAAYATSRGKLAQPASWRRAWRTGALNLLQSGVMCEPSRANYTVVGWLESLADSLVPTSVWPVSGQVSPENIADCGLNISELFGKCNPDGSISKMSQQSSLFQQEELYSEGLMKAGSMRSGYLFERPTWERRIDASESLSSHGDAAWKTPHGMGGLGIQWGDGFVGGVAKNWHTPSTEDTKTDGPKAEGRYATPEMKTSDQRLRTQVRLWTTPQSHDSGGSSAVLGYVSSNSLGFNLADDVMLLDPNE